MWVRQSSCAWFNTRGRENYTCLMCPRCPIRERKRILWEVIYNLSFLSQMFIKDPTMGWSSWEKPEKRNIGTKLSFKDLKIRQRKLGFTNFIILLLDVNNLYLSALLSFYCEVVSNTLNNWQCKVLFHSLLPGLPTFNCSHNLSFYLSLLTYKMYMTGPES